MRPANQLADRLVARGRLVLALRRRWGMMPVWLVLLATLVLVLVTLDVLNRGALTSLDHEVSRHVVELHIRDHRWPKRLVYVLTLFGQRGTVLVLTIPTVAYLCWRSRSTEPAVRYVVALLALTVAVYAFKEAVGRTAPTVDLLHTGSGESFPSGHVTNALLIWGVVWWSARRIDAQMWLTRVLNVFRLIGPVCVVIGMTLLDYHWLSDFIAGVALAILLLGAVTLPLLGALSRDLDRRFVRQSFVR